MFIGFHLLSFFSKLSSVFGRGYRAPTSTVGPQVRRASETQPRPYHSMRHSDRKSDKCGLINLLVRTCGRRYYTSIATLRVCVAHLLPSHFGHISWGTYYTSWGRCFKIRHFFSTPFFPSEDLKGLDFYRSVVWPLNMDGAGVKGFCSGVVTFFFPVPLGLRSHCIFTKIYVLARLMGAEKSHLWSHSHLGIS